MCRAFWFFAVLVLANSTRAGEVCSSITHEELNVDGRNDEWTSAAVKVQAGDLVLVFARGKVRIGPFLGEVTANGHPSGAGRLDMKIGTGTVVPVGERWVGAFRDGGALKFRMYDKKYSDNAGQYRVHLIIIPAIALPPAVHVETD